MAKFKKSFYEWCLENNHEDYLELWDYNLNEDTPKDISYGSVKKRYFKCSRNLHKSELKEIRIIAKREYQLKCNQCNSFGQYLIDTYGKDALERYWDYKKNKVDPFKITKKSNKKVWIFCQKKDYHGSYEITCVNFTQGKRCSYCWNFKVHPKDSLGQKLINDYGEDAIERYWSKKNTISPFEIAPYSNQKYWFICQNDEEHEDYEMRVADFICGKRCSKCNESKGERKISKWLDNENIKYIREKTFPNLLGVGKDCLRYDFYLPDYNLLIEYQGIQHYTIQDFTGEGKDKAEKKFLEQQEHDRRKKEYSRVHNIRLLEICYTDFDNIEKILNNLFKGEKNYGKQNKNE